MNRPKRSWRRAAILLAAVISLISPRAETVQYAYDEAGRLIGAYYDDGTSIGYLYDGSGNLLRRSITTFVDPGGNAIDDGWELQHFGEIGIEAEGDADGDGASNLEEFFAGTDPKDAGDVLRVNELTTASGVSFRVRWVAVPGKVYRVQFNESLLPHDWKDLPGDIVATGETASRTDETAGKGTKRFYRVRVLH